MGTSASPRPLEADPEAVRGQLRRIVTSAEFHGAHRQQAFLNFVVAESLSGRGHEIKETLIATAVYHKPADYDPRIDSTVRVEASKLRQRLTQYYEGPGAADPVRLSIPKGSYHLQVDSPAAPEPVPEPAAPSRHWRMAFFALAGLLLAGFIWRLVETGQESGPLDASRLRVNRLTEATSFSSSPVLSPKGDVAVYASDRDTGGVLNLWRQPLDGGTAVRLTRSGFDHDMPAVSPDGSMVVFRTAEEGGMLAWIPMSGGEPRPFKGTGGARHPRFGPESKPLLYWVPRDEETVDYGQVFLASAALDPEHAPVRLFGDFAHATRPIWSDGGQRVLAAGTWQSDAPDKEFDAWMLDLDGRHAKGPPRKTGLFPALKSQGLYRSLLERSQIELAEWRGDWLYLTIPMGEFMDLFRIRLPGGEGRVRGEPQRLTFGAGNVRSARVAANGRIVFARSEISYDLFSLRAPARAQPGEDLHRHTSETGMNFRASIHPSGKSGAWEKRRPGSGGQVWFFDLASGARVKLGLAEDRVSSHALISPDGASVAYRVFEPGVQPIYLQPVAGGPAKRICDNCGTPSDWAAGGKHLFYVTGGQPARAGLLDLESGKNHDLIKHPSTSLFGLRARVDSSGDGWVAFYGDNGGRTRQIFLAPMRRFNAAGQPDWIPVTDGTHWDQSPAWAPGGRALFYVNRHDGFACIMARSLDASGQPEGAPWAVRHFHAPGQTLMRSMTNRGADGLWVAGQRVFFTLDNRASDLWSLDLAGQRK